MVSPQMLQGFVQSVHLILELHTENSATVELRRNVLEYVRLCSDAHRVSTKYCVPCRQSLVSIPRLTCLTNVHHGLDTIQNGYTKLNNAQYSIY